MVVVVPPLAEGQQGQPEVVAAVVSGLVAHAAEAMGQRVDRVRGVPEQRRRDAEAPDQPRQAPDREAQHPHGQRRQGVERRLREVRHRPQSDGIVAATGCNPAAERVDSPFELPAEAVVKKLVHALESPRPHPRYYVTVPTHAFGFLKRLLPTRALDWLARKAVS